MSNKEHWMSDFYEKHKADLSFRRHNSAGKDLGYYTHCECCDRTLLKFQQPSGLCGECFDIVASTSNPENHFEDTWFIENELWKNRQGSLEDEIYDMNWEGRTLNE